MFFITSLHLTSALDKDYFNKLRTQKVLSTDSITWEQFGPGNAGLKGAPKVYLWTETTQVEPN